MVRKNLATKVLILTLTMLMAFNFGMPFNYAIADENEEAITENIVEKTEPGKPEDEEAEKPGDEETEQLGDEEAGDVEPGKPRDDEEKENNEDDENIDKEETPEETPQEEPEKAPEEKPEEIIADKMIMRSVIPGGDVYLHTYNFIVDGVIKNTQIVKNNDMLFRPITPHNDNHKFIYWCTEKGIVFDRFGVQSDITETKIVNITAKFQKVYYVTFLNDEDKIFATKNADVDDEIVLDVTFSLPSNKSLIAWRADDGTEYDINSEITLTGNITLTPVIKEGHSIIFNTGMDASLISPQFVAVGENTVEPAAPIRLGYDFDKWMNGEEDFDFGSTINGEINLTAKWTPREADYTVIHWQEKADDDGYAVFESEKIPGLTEADTNAETKNYEGFTSQNITQKIINGDGSTIVNVYYDRKEYDVKFYIFEDYKYVLCEELTISAKYGMNISKKWPSARTDLAINTWPSKWEAETGMYQQGIEIMPLNGADFYEVYEGGMYIIKANYYLERLNVAGYFLKHSDSFNSNNNSWIVTEEDRYPIDGFNLNKNKSYNINASYKNEEDSDFIYHADFYYNRNTYRIDFFNNDEIDETVNAKYESDISSVNYTPNNPPGKEDYVFKGWYTDEEGHVDHIVFDEMPAHNIIAYAKWDVPEINVIVDTNVEGVNNFTMYNIPVAYREKTYPESMPHLDIQEGYEFVYWAEKDSDENLTMFNFDTRLTEDLILYPYIRDSSEYHVVYNLNGGSGQLPEDDGLYKIDSSAVVMPSTGIIAPDEKMFLYWTTDMYGNGDKYYPNSTIDITGNMNLYAHFGPKQEKATLQYHTNYQDDTGNKSSEVEVYENNAELTVKSLSELGFEVPDNYVFDGWKDAEGNKFNAGDQIIIDNTVVGDEIIIDNASVNNLIAQWVKKTEITLDVNNGSFVYDGNEKSISGFISNSFNVNNDAYLVTGIDAEAKGTDVGKYPSIITGEAIVEDAEGRDVTEYFKISYNNGELEITPADVTVVAKDASKEYGMSDPVFEAEVNGLIGEDEVDYNVGRVGSEEAVGLYENAIVASGSSTQGNYAVTYETADFRINKISNELIVIITGGKMTSKYNGNIQSVEGYSHNAPEDVNVELMDDLQSMASGTDAGTYMMGLNAEYFNVISDNYEEITVEVEDGSLVIIPRDIIFTSATDSKEYDSTALMNSEVTVSGDEFVEGEGAEFEVTGSQTLVGTSENTFTYTLTDGTKDINYNVTANKGTLTVTSRDAKHDITVEANSGEFKYDGTEKSVSGLKENTFVFDEEEYTVTGLTVEAKGTNAGSYVVNITGIAIVLDSSENDVTSEFAVTPVNGTLVINKRAVTLTSGTSERYYNGSALTNSNVVISGDDFVEGEGLEFTVTGSQTSVGTSDNAFDYEFKENTLAENYDITKTLGTLRVNRRHVDPPVDPPEDPVDPVDPPEDPVDPVDPPEDPVEPDPVEPEEEIDEPEIPGGELTEETEEVEEVEEEILDDDVLPAGELPNTGGIPMSLLYLIGSSSIISGLFLKKKKEDR